MFHAIPDERGDVDPSLAHGGGEPLRLSAHDRLVERDDNQTAARAIVQQCVQRPGALREVEQLLRRLAESHDVAVLEHETHQAV